MSKSWIKWMGAIAVLVTAPLAAQTPENTVITNSVSVAYTDANGNAYDPATSAVSVTVGFAAGLDLTGSATVTPASPSTSNETLFTISNIGNGTDSVSVAVAAGAGLTITGYRIGATAYATLAELNDALAGTSIAGITGTVGVTVVYTVGPLLGGETRTITLTATSRRDNAETDLHATNVSPPIAGDVTVAAVTSSINRVPGGGAPYSTTFTITNSVNTTITYDLTTGVAGSGVTAGVINGGTAFVTIAGNSAATVTVEYAVGPAALAAGTSGTLTLTATAQVAPAITASGTHTVTIIKSALSLTKEVFMADGTTPITAAMRVLPGQEIVYRLTITNTGGAAAHDVEVTDVLPSDLAYVSHEAPAGWSPSFVTGTATFTAALTGTMAPAASAVITIRATVR